uniref:protein-tyrosine-phosphatase n=1 Tax=Gadus morhua TaxID=8049 RepID=A0A8C5AEF3_GADMO
MCVMSVTRWSPLHWWMSSPPPPPPPLHESPDVLSPPGTLNQDNWVKKYPSCSSARQSPLDLEEDLAQVRLEYQDLRFEGWTTPTSDRTTAKNDGKTVAVTLGGDFFVSGGGLGSRFRAARLTFHWGRCNASSEGSEHSLDGVKAPLEMQIYCYEDDLFDSLDHALKEGGRITAIAVLFQVCVVEDNENYEAIINAVNAVSRYGKSGEVEAFSPQALLPNSTQRFFIYNGSLTTPPCSETVQWIVLKEPASISDAQLEVFCEVMTMQQAGYVMLMDYLQNNFREQPPRFTGQVYSSYTGSEELKCSSEPEKVLAVAQNRSSLLVMWERPRSVYDGAIDRYAVRYRPAGNPASPTIEYLTDGDQDVGAILQDLLANTSYSLEVVAVCTGGLLGRLSDQLTVTMPTYDPGKSDPASPGRLHGDLCVCSSPDASNSSHESRVGAVGLTEAAAVVPLAVVSVLTGLGLMVLMGILYWSLQRALLQSSRLEAEALVIYGSAGVQSSVCGWVQELQAYSMDIGMTSDSARHPDNKTKNRYVNVLAYDHSRVRLSTQTDSGQTGDYINANYVDGFNQPRAYIAAQGPLRSSVDDFWRMVWEQRTGVIVMITNLMENGRRKCDQYWPMESQEEYGGFLVTVKSVKELAFYTQRTFTLRNTRLKKVSQKGRGAEQTVLHFQYTQWPDMGVPEYALPLLTFIRRSSQARTPDMGPVVVHCSAGVGRTGTYLVLDSMLQQIRQQGTVNIKGFLQHIRTQRNFLVQTQQQYVFLHDVLVEAVQTREAEVGSALLHRYVDELLTSGPSGNTRLEKQFKLISLPGGQHGDFSAAMRESNRSKNRPSSVIPGETLSSIVRVNETLSDKVRVSGYRRCREFLVTQRPLPSTVRDFWTMVWDQGVQTIVSLPHGDHSTGEPEPCAFWPKKQQPISCERFTVTQRGENTMCLSGEENLVIQELLLQAAQDDFVLEVKLFRTPCWPDPERPPSSTLELVHLVREARAGEGPMLVQDLTGGVAAGTFCSLISLVDQLEGEESVDVFQTVRMTNLMRPGTFTQPPITALLHHLGLLNAQYYYTYN